MSNNRGKSVVTAVAVAMTACVAVVTVPGAAQADPVILEQHATVTQHATGIPNHVPSAEPGRQLASAQIDIEILGGTRFYDYTVQLAGVPARDEADSQLTVGFGHKNATGVCVGEKGDGDELDSGDGSRIVGGYYIDPEDETLDPRPWDCVFVVLDDVTVGSTVVYDAMVADLTNVVGDAELTLSAPKKVKVVKGFWTDVEVEVGNTGEIKAENVKITGSGKGVKVRPLTLSSAIRQDDDPSTIEVEVKLTQPRRSANLTLKVSSGSSSVTRTMVVKRKRPPARPVSGSYSNGAVSFTIKKGKVRGFRVTTQTTCGGYPDLPTYTQNTYDFPTVKIPGNGIVDAVDRGNQGSDSAYAVTLEMYVVGGRVVRGSFYYGGPARCHAAEGFKNLRVKR